MDPPYLINHVQRQDDTCSAHFQQRSTDMAKRSQHHCKSSMLLLMGLVHAYLTLGGSFSHVKDITVRHSVLCMQAIGGAGYLQATCMGVLPLEYHQHTDEQAQAEQARDRRLCQGLG